MVRGQSTVECHQQAPEEGGWGRRLRAGRPGSRLLCGQPEDEGRRPGQGLGWDGSALEGQTPGRRLSQ